jgi:hypothetical protein
MPSPVIDREASEVRKTAAAAMSSGSTNRLSGAELVTSSKPAAAQRRAARLCVNGLGDLLAGAAAADAQSVFTRPPSIT